MKKAAIFGDSIMRGMFWNEKLAKHKLWQNPYPARIAAESGIEIENHSFIGSTIKRGRAIFDKVRNKGLHCDLLLLEYGGNDSGYDWAQNAAAPQEEHFPQNQLSVF